MNMVRHNKAWDAKLESVYGYQKFATFETYSHVQCFDAVGLVTGSVSGLSESCLSSPKDFSLVVFGGPGLTWSNRWKNRPVKQENDESRNIQSRDKYNDVCRIYCYRYTIATVRKDVDDRQLCGVTTTILL